MMTLRFLPGQIELWPLGRLKPYANNARTHSDDQIAKIAGSLAEYGWTSPLLVSDAGEIIAGHGRVLAAQSLGLSDVPVIRLTHLTAAQAKALRIADNRLAELAGWDDELLAIELAELDDLDFDLDLTGFDGAELDRLLALADGEGEGADDEDIVPEAPVDPVTRPGDLWVLGEHRLLCGDATVRADVERLLGGARPHLMVTDPPYGVNYDPAWRNDAGVSTTTRIGTVRNDNRCDWRDAWALFPGDVAYVWHAGVHGQTVADSLQACGFTIRAQLIWAKSRFALSRGHYHWQHEPCFYAVRDGGDSHWQGARDQSTLWPVACRSDDDDATVHGTQKPVECMLRPIRNNSARGDSVYEPFAGSGTTIIAAERSGRRCLAMELDPSYCDVIVGRWQAATVRHATLAATGRTFDDVADARLSSRSAAE